MLLSGKKLHNKGITLIELIIVLAILGLVIGMAFSLFGFGNKIFKNGSGQYDVQSAVRLASHYITEETRFAADIEILNSFPGTIAVYDNYLYYDSSTGFIRKVNNDGTTNKFIGLGGALTFVSSPSSDTLEYIMTAVEDTRNYNITNKVLSLNIGLGIDKFVTGNLTSTGGTVIRYRTVSDYISGTQAPTVVKSTTINDKDAIELTFSNIASAAIKEPQGDETLTVIGNVVHISFSPTVNNKREVMIEVNVVYDGVTSTYAYTLTYYNNDKWVIQN